jgi:MoxR-like ATPase
MQTTIQEIKKEVQKVIVGHEKLIDALLIGLLSDGHILVEGVPGLAKTTAINALSNALGLDFKRIQFTPDLLPSDITGTEIYDQKNGIFRVRKGPAFTNLLLADEINRAPAKVQAALLEVMQERQITIGEETFKLEEPFLVLATQNPVEQEGAYKLPEAQLDRFMLNVIVDYNTFDEEFDIVKRVAEETFGVIQKVADKTQLATLKEQAKSIHIDDALLKYILNIIFATRDPQKYGIEEIGEYIEYGASPRASINLYKAVKSVALLKGKDFVSPLDVIDIAPDILRHRIILNYKAEAQGIKSDDVINKIIQNLPLP